MPAFAYSAIIRAKPQDIVPSGSLLIKKFEPVHPFCCLSGKRKIPIPLKTGRHTDKFCQLWPGFDSSNIFLTAFLFDFYIEKLKT